MEEMKQYMGRSGKDRLVIALAGGVCGVLGVMQLTRGALVIGGVLMAVCALLLYSALRAKRQDAAALSALGDELDAAAADFGAAEELAEGTLRLGR